MKNITEYINEVSKEVVDKAISQAKGAQKNRIKKLYNEIYNVPKLSDRLYDKYHMYGEFEEIKDDNNPSFYVCLYKGRDYSNWKTSSDDFFYKYHHVAERVPGQPSGEEIHIFYLDEIMKDIKNEKKAFNKITSFFDDFLN